MQRTALILSTREHFAQGVNILLQRFHLSFQLLALLQGVQSALNLR